MSTQQAGKGHGLEFPLEELTAQVANDGAELTDEMLDKVAGGAGGLGEIDLQSTMQEPQQSVSVVTGLGGLVAVTMQSPTRKLGG